MHYKAYSTIHNGVTMNTDDKRTVSNKKLKTKITVMDSVLQQLADIHPGTECTGKHSALMSVHIFLTCLNSERRMDRQISNKPKRFNINTAKKSDNLHLLNMTLFLGIVNAMKGQSLMVYFLQSVRLTDTAKPDCMGLVAVALL